MINLSVKAEQIDLSKGDSLDSIGTFENIVINHYRLTKDQLSKIHKNIKDKGVLFICGFSKEHICNERIKIKDLIHKFDLDNLYINFNLVKVIETENKNNNFVTYIFMKKQNML